MKLEEKRQLGVLMRELDYQEWLQIRQLMDHKFRAEANEKKPRAESRAHGWDIEAMLDRISKECITIKAMLVATALLSVLATCLAVAR